VNHTKKAIELKSKCCSLKLEHEARIKLIAQALKEMYEEGRRDEVKIQKDIKEINEDCLKLNYDAGLKDGYKQAEQETARRCLEIMTKELTYESDIEFAIKKEFGIGES